MKQLSQHAREAGQMMDKMDSDHACVKRLINKGIAVKAIVAQSDRDTIIVIDPPHPQAQLRLGLTFGTLRRSPTHTVLATRFMGCRVQYTKRNEGVAA